MVHNDYLHTDGRLIRFANCYLIEPDSGNLSTCTASLWVDKLLGTIARVVMEDKSVVNCFVSESGQDPSIGEEALDAAPTIDLQGQVLAPGLIDIQINGAYGIDFSHWPGEEEDYVSKVGTVSTRLAETGVTAYLPTVISQTPDMYEQIIPALHSHAVDSLTTGAAVIGYHLEGPFLAPSKIGCHPADNARDASEGWRSFVGIYGQTIIEPAEEFELAKIITLAPEVLGVMDCIPRLVEEGYTISIGHSGANTQQAAQAVTSGASLITHLFNAMPAFHHREPGIIGLLGAAPGCHENGGGKHPSQTLQSALPTPVASQVLSKIERLGGVESPLPSMETKPSESNNQNSRPFQRPFWSCIADGLHVHPFAVNLAYQTHPEGCVLVTDAVSWRDPNLPDGVYPWRSQDHTVTKKGDSITLTDTDTLAGAAVPLDKCVRNLAKFCGIPLSKAIHCASRNPAKCLGGSVVKSKGALKVGFDADLTVWDKETGELLSTWRAGRHVFGKLELRNPT